MSASTVLISEKAHETLRELVQTTGQTMQDILDRAVEDYRRKVFIDAVNAGYDALRANPEAWAEHLAERQTWDTTLADGLDSEEHWTEDGRCLNPDPETE